jgi:hypothetical protein
VRGCGSVKNRIAARARSSKASSDRPAGITKTRRGGHLTSVVVSSGTNVMSLIVSSRCTVSGCTTSSSSSDMQRASTPASTQRTDFRVKHAPLANAAGVTKIGNDNSGRTRSGNQRGSPFYEKRNKESRRRLIRVGVQAGRFLPPVLVPGGGGMRRAKL